ncbi:hypothetical protein [Spirosoma humi]
MKQKTDESPDQWVRQTLSQLPDAPPPDSSFDKDELWAKLRPELQSVSAPRSPTRLVWWMAAACIGALMVGWGWLSHQSAPESTVAVVHRKKPETRVARQRPFGSTRANEADTSKDAFSAAARSHIALHTQHPQPVRSDVRVTPPVSTSAASPSSTPDDVSTLTETPAVVDKLPALPKQKLAETRPKRRFQVVHENELRAEEETRPKLYCPDRFVRLSSGQDEEPRPEASRPALIMSLTNKPNQ